MKYLSFVFILAALTLNSCLTNTEKLSLDTDWLKLTIDNTGNIAGFKDILTNKDYLAREEPAPLISLQFGEEILLPEKASFDNNNLILLNYMNNITAEIGYTETPTHITFELKSVSDSADLIIWGPYPTTIDKIIGETIGVVRGDEYALGIQALNMRTLGGYPWNDNDCMPQIDIFDQDDPSDMSEAGKRYVLYRVEAAKPTNYGSSLQAYCRNRNKERIIGNWGHEKYTAPSFYDEGITGSSIAIFGCPVEKTLETIGKIEIAENLPHPTIDGQWGKTARSASAAYIILDFAETDIERAIEITKKAGLRYLYHSGPFETWGRFRLRSDQFPQGIEGMKQCVEKARENNIFIGVHTLSNFITTNDPYVTPVPDERLAKVGSSQLSDRITQHQVTILVESPGFFNQYNNNHLKTVAVGDELIRYGRVSEEIPWKLLDCQRGAFGTVAAIHEKGEAISKLADHAYKVFLTNPYLSIEVSENIAAFFNQTGVRQISFDGLEGNRSTGMGNYGEVLFTTTWYNSLNQEIRQHFIADASRTSHYFWHIYTRMNWGEPWYAGFRESQTEYRLKNQDYFRRNLMPGMLGWFRMNSSTSVEDIEWMLARSAAFNAGYAFVVDYRSMEENGCTEAILKLLGEWEKIRMADGFSEDQKERMREISNEFHLETINETEWNLYQVYSNKFSYDRKEKQPGEPSYTTYNIDNPAETQAMNFIITSVDGNLRDIIIGVDNYREIRLNTHLRKDESIKYTGGDKATVYDKNRVKLGEIEIGESALQISKGSHTINFECAFTEGDEPRARLELRFTDKPEKIKILK